MERKTLADWLAYYPTDWAVWFNYGHLIAAYDGHYTLYNRLSGECLGRGMTRDLTRNRLVDLGVDLGYFGETCEACY